METSAEIAQAFLNLSDAGFFTIGPNTLSQIEWKLSSRAFRGLALSACSEIQIQQRDTLPILLASQIGAVRDWETPLADNLSLLVYEHDTARVTAAKAFDEQKEQRHELAPPEGKRELPRPEGKSPKPTGDAATGVATSVRQADMRQLFSLEWRTRRLSFVALSFDVASNTADVSLIGGTEPTQAVAREITPLPNGDGKGFPSYDPSIVKVPLVAQGVTFTVASQPTLPGYIVRGALGTKMQARHRPRNPASVGSKRVAAVIPASFIVTGRDLPVPWIVEWGIPVLGEREIAIGAPLSAVFAIPLPEATLRMMPAAEYAAYVMVEGQVFGPQKFTMSAAMR